MGSAQACRPLNTFRPPRATPGAPVVAEIASVRTRDADLTGIKCTDRQESQDKRKHSEIESAGAGAHWTSFSARPASLTIMSLERTELERLARASGKNGVRLRHRADNMKPVGPNAYRAAERSSTFTMLWSRRLSSQGRIDGGAFSLNLVSNLWLRRKWSLLCGKKSMCILRT